MKLIHNTICFCFFIDWQTFHCLKHRKCFGIFGVFVKEIVIFNIGFGFVVLESIWWHGLKIFLELFSSSSSSSSSSVVVVVVRRRRPSSSSVVVVRRPSSVVVRRSSVVRPSFVIQIAIKRWSFWSRIFWKIGIFDFS